MKGWALKAVGVLSVGLLLGCSGWLSKSLVTLHDQTLDEVRKQVPQLEGTDEAKASFVAGIDAYRARMEAEGTEVTFEGLSEVATAMDVVTRDGKIELAEVDGFYNALGLKRPTEQNAEAAAAGEAPASEDAEAPPAKEEAQANPGVEGH